MDREDGGGLYYAAGLCSHGGARGSQVALETLIQSRWTCTVPAGLEDSGE